METWREIRTWREKDGGKVKHGGIMEPGGETNESRRGIFLWRCSGMATK